MGEQISTRKFSITSQTDKFSGDWSQQVRNTLRWSGQIPAKYDRLAQVALTCFRGKEERRTGSRSLGPAVGVLVCLAFSCMGRTRICNKVAISLRASWDFSSELALQKHTHTVVLCTSTVKRLFALITLLLRHFISAQHSDGWTTTIHLPQSLTHHHNMLLWCR